MKLHHFLYLALGLNTAVIVACGYLVTRPDDETDLSLKAQFSQAPAQIAAEPVHAVVGPTHPYVAFRSARVKSESFSTGIANLRADVPTEAPRHEEQAVLEQWPRNRETVVASLLTTNHQLAAAARAPQHEALPSLAIAQSSAAVREASGPVLLPAALVPTDPASLNQLQAAERQRIEDDFVERVGGPNQDPSDPDYRARWLSAQEISDTKFRAKFGHQAFLQHNIEAGRRLGEP